MFEPVIGLEIHVQLRTATKLFCGCEAAAAAGPNSRVCPVCLGLPGALPVLNGAAVDQAVTAALALGCAVHPVSIFVRKNYFYPDLPKGYQITQYDRPLATGGALSWTRREHRVEVRIARVHLEEDAGKSHHDGTAGGSGDTRVDFNRSGIPLAEIVTAPDLRSAEDAADCFRRIRAVLMEAGVTDGNLEAGSLRCDANVSLRGPGGELGEKCEIKNVNSFRFLQRALEHEIARQAALLAGGGRVEPGTRLWDERRGETVSMRTKEEASEYRYFPEPDLPPLAVAVARIEARRSRLPELPASRAARLRARHALSGGEAEQLAASAACARFFEAVVDQGADPAAASQWIRGELVRRLHETGRSLEDEPVAPAALARLIGLVDDGVLSASSAKHVLGRMVESGGAPDAIVAAEGLALVSDERELTAWIEAAIADSPAAVAQYRQGRRGALGFIVGVAMKASGGRADPRALDRLARARLDGTGPS